MKKYIIIIMLLMPTIVNAGAFKVQVHSHTDKTCGVYSAEYVNKIYSDLGYSLVISDVETKGKFGHYLIIAGLKIIAHPNWLDDRWTYAEMDETEFDLIEIYNGHVMSKDATDKWEYLLKKGRKVYGVAVDDSHTGFNKGWIIVYADSVDGIFDSIREGNFYSATTDTMGITYGDGKITVDINGMAIVNRISDKSHDTGDPTENTTFIIRPDEKYLRIEIKDEHGSVWSNPIFNDR